MKKLFTCAGMLALAAAMALSVSAAKIPLPQKTIVVVDAPAATLEQPAADEVVEGSYSASAQYVKDSKLLSAYRYTSSLASANIDMEILTNLDATDKVTVKKTDAESTMSFAFGIDFKAKEFVLGTVAGSADYALYASEDGQTWTQTVTRTVIDKENDVVRILNTQGKAMPFLKLVITPVDDEVSFGSFTIAQATAGHDFSDVPISNTTDKQMPVYAGVPTIIR